MLNIHQSAFAVRSLCRICCPLNHCRKSHLGAKIGCWALISSPDCRFTGDLDLTSCPCADPANLGLCTLFQAATTLHEACCAERDLCAGPQLHEHGELMSPNDEAMLQS